MEAAAPFFLSGDGEHWAPFAAGYALGGEPVVAAMKGRARVLSEMEPVVLAAPSTPPVIPSETALANSSAQYVQSAGDAVIYSR